MKKLIILLVLSFIITESVLAQELITAELQKNSVLTIKGSTNIVPFKIYQDGDKLFRNKFSITTTQSDKKIFLSQNQLSVVVKNFESDNRMALKDFLKLLKSDTYPNLNVQLNYLDLQPITEKGVNYNGNALVSITITGKTKKYIIPISFSSNGETYTVDGNKRLSIIDFGLTPESKMMGLIKVSEWIEIDFHMICKITTNGDIVKL